MLLAHGAREFKDGGDAAPEQLSPAVRALLETRLYVSAATIWELLIKARKQLIDFGGDPAQRLQEYGAALQAIALPVSAAHLYRAFTLEGLHKDPFDRLLIAQAQDEGLALVTRDRSVERYPIETIW